ncbi:hypothetical protein GUJ93_ZPchr0002g24009 [Zizania palustris]|uniref:Uncharacterized protein n=1 Tax=Zizania palustris TaxID=103762 RepID=A0A8J5SGT5_ZIZPA|nr:hypothetical protein GUJ93_ZPchr0002g24009 [Zizania palustris]
MSPAPPFVVAEAVAVAVVAVTFAFAAYALASDLGGGCREEGHRICVGISPTQPRKWGKRAVCHGVASGLMMGRASCCSVGLCRWRAPVNALDRV